MTDLLTITVDLKSQIIDDDLVNELIQLKHKLHGAHDDDSPFSHESTTADARCAAAFDGFDTHAVSSTHNTCNMSHDEYIQHI